ncbi:hypothetical protein G9A89_014209 [Geosiphon pyriformis]|nr:hypothetical protein G9A89_014209 [Geosiphon pyriformis]
MEVTQYQALVGNDWLSKNNAVLDWTTQKLQLSQNSQHTQVLATCGHFKPNNATTSVPLIDLEKEKLKPTWKAYQKKSISSCTLELESLFNPDSNSDNDDDENNGSSSIQNGNNNDNNINSDSNSNSNYEQYIALSNLTKEQELKWFSNNNKGIMPEHVHNTNAGFDLKYPRKDVIKLEPYSCICIDLKIVLEIPATTMVQLASRNSLAKKGINIRGKIINAGYVGNIIAMLQNNSEKAYIIEPNEKIAQAIFLPLVKIAQLVPVGNREELGITARGIQGFGSTGRIDVSVNITEEEIVGQGEIISTGQAISILPYSQYMLAIERKEKEQEQIFEAEVNLCESGEIGMINLYIPAKSYSRIKISIYNNTDNVINIPEGTTIGYLTTEIEDQPPNPIPDFSQLCGYVDITSQTIYRRDKCYLLQSEQLEQMNMGNLDSLQCMQLKMLLNNFNDIFASKMSLAELILSSIRSRLEMQCQLNSEHTEYHQPAMKSFVKRSTKYLTMG